VRCFTCENAAPRTPGLVCVECNRVIGSASDCAHENYVLNGIKPGWACQKCGEPLATGSTVAEVQNEK
jgi:hypothetical protein